MKLKINISLKLKALLDIITSDYDIEISGYLIGRIKNNEIFIDDLLIPSSQSINSVMTSITPQDQIELLKKYGKKVQLIIGHFHSHHHMGCFWSGTDQNNMRQIMESKNFYVFIVGSKKDYLIKTIIKNPFYYEFDDAILNINNLYLQMMRNFVDNIVKRNKNINYYEKDTLKEFVEEAELEKEKTEEEEE